MKLSSLLGHSREVLQLVRESGKPADNLIDFFFRSHKYLGSHDRRFISETVYGTLRHLRKCETILLQALGARSEGMIAEDGFLLLIATYLLAIEDRTPIAASDLGEVLKSGRLKPDLPALLRSIPAVAVVETTDPVERLGATYSFPDWMVKRFIDQFGEAEAGKLCESLNAPAPLTLRANTLKTTPGECRETLRQEGVETQATTLSPFGLLLRKRINVFQLKSFRDGFFEVQDEGSQLLPYLIDPKPTAKVLDACAGAGGKTLELAALMKNRGEIVAADVHTSRLEELRRRARRAGVSNVRVREVEDIADLADRYQNYFDVVLVDAPCSGIGTVRRNPGMKWVVTEETVREVSEKQLHILKTSASFLKPGGILVYATCTLFREENEDIVEKFMADRADFVHGNPPLNPSIFDVKPFVEGNYIKFYPHRDGTDGFFVAVMKKQMPAEN
jgi:16S rRNA (cytosine967-C5)-methyltransferase